MAAPGKHLEFEELDRFRDRCKSVPGLKEKVIQAVQNHLAGGELVVAHIRKVELSLGGKSYTAYLGRRKTTIGLVAVFELPADEAMRIAFVQGLKETYS